MNKTNNKLEMDDVYFTISSDSSVIKKITRNFPDFEKRYRTMLILTVNKIV